MSIGICDVDTATLTRLQARITRNEDGCWVWAGAISRGYAQAAYSGRVHQVHRLMYEHFVGPIPNGLNLDHLCHTRDTTCPGGSACLHRRCVNPEHMEPVTHWENNSRSLSLTAENLRKTHCPNRHAYEGANLYVDKTGRRHCRTCTRVANRKYYQRHDGAAQMRARRAKQRATNGEQHG